MIFRKHVYSGAIAICVMALPATAENLTFNFLSPSFGGNPQNGAFLFSVAQAQASATNRVPITGGVGGGGGTPTGGGDVIGGPTIIIPINTDSGGPTVVQPGAAASGTEALIQQID